MDNGRIYAAIDLKSFYASVECRERGLNPLSTNLVVADLSRTEKTICLAVTPSLKSMGISGRPRLFEVVQQINNINNQRRKRLANGQFSGKSFDSYVLSVHPELEVDYIVATPRMALYMEYSTRIYGVYLRHVAPEDIHVYSIDEVFIDLTSYLQHTKMSAREFTKMLICDVFEETGITAAAGIGTNLYLCKVAMDITAKHIKEDSDGVRIAELDEMSYRRTLWSHRPITDFWRVGHGYAKKLEGYGLYTMGDVARCSLHGEDLLYRLFGVNAELLIDHAWGYEPCTIADIKAYKPLSNSMGSGQVLHCPADYERACLIVREMADILVLDLVEKGLMTNQIVLTLGYDAENLSNPSRAEKYRGQVVTDHYGRKVPKHAHGSVNLEKYSSSTKIITDAVMSLMESISDKKLLIRRINIAACNVLAEGEALSVKKAIQLDLFTDYEEDEKQERIESERLKRERRRQNTLIRIKNKYGKNSIVKGMSLQDGATAIERNKQIGGHKE